MRSVLGFYICKQCSSRFSYYFNQRLTVACIFILIRKDEHVNRTACVNVALGSQRGSMLTRHVRASKSQTDSAKPINYRRVARSSSHLRDLRPIESVTIWHFPQLYPGLEKKTLYTRTYTVHIHLSVFKNNTVNVTLFES